MTSYWSYEHRMAGNMHEHTKCKWPVASHTRFVWLELGYVETEDVRTYEIRMDGTLYGHTNFVWPITNHTKCVWLVTGHTKFVWPITSHTHFIWLVIRYVQTGDVSHTKCVWPVLYTFLRSSYDQITSRTQFVWLKLGYVETGDVRPYDIRVTGNLHGHTTSIWPVIIHTKYVWLSILVYAICMTSH